jgi:hypothetical protein
MPRHIFAADQAFGALMCERDPDVIVGYHLWAQPVVTMMHKSKLFTGIVKAIAMPWACEMAFQMGVEHEGNLIGKILMTIGLPTCRILGKLSSLKIRRVAK